MKRILVCGGRDFNDNEFLKHQLTALFHIYGQFVLVHGDARGADTLAKEWAEHVGLPIEAYPADWKKHGKRAGPIRNREMLASGIDYVVAFPGGEGTAHMVSIASREGILVWDLRRGKRYGW